jgi:hypothetical protein
MVLPTSGHRRVHQDVTEKKEPKKLRELKELQRYHEPITHRRLPYAFPLRGGGFGWSVIVFLRREF